MIAFLLSTPVLVPSENYITLLVLLLILIVLGAALWLFSRIIP